MAQLSMNLWNTTAGYGSVGPKIEYLSDEQNCRRERTRVARMLWKGQHRKAFLDEGRTQFPFPPMKDAEGRTIIPYVTYNVLRLVTTTITDLLVGEEPLLRHELPAVEETLGDLVKRSDLHRVLYDAAKEASWAAEATVEISRYDGEVYVSNVPPGELFPLGARNADGQYTSYRRFATEKVGDKTYLLETTYLPGSITRECFLLDGTAKKGLVKLEEWPVKREDGGPLLDVEPTGIQWNSIVWLPNELDEGKPTSDYDGLLELQDELNAKQTQIARVLAKHADPKLGVPASMVGPDGNLLSSHDVFFFRSKEEIPAYITWNAELANAMADRDFTLHALCTAAELSPVLLGIRQGATPDAARKLRLEATKSLARMKRKGTFFAPFVRTVIDTALMMEDSARVVKVAVGGGASVELRDGLPVDGLDEAQELTLLTGGKPVMSVERAVQRQLVDPEAVEEELKRLSAQAAADTPPILMGAGGAGGEEPGADAGAAVLGGEEQSDAVATNDLRQTVGGSVAVRDLQKAYYEGSIPREAAIANLVVVFGFTRDEAEDFLPEVKPDAPGGGAKPAAGAGGFPAKGGAA